MNIYDKKYYYYELPEELIAQDPLSDRAASRLMVLSRDDGSVTHRLFSDITDYLTPGDCLVLNNTKVIPARLLGHKDTGAAVEVLLLNRINADSDRLPADRDTTKNSVYWECIVRPGKRLQEGARVIFGDGRMTGVIAKVLADGNRIVELSFDGIFEEVLDALGEMPLPPYITHKLKDRDRYNTVYAKFDGSAAAPTAGLHFTGELLEKVRDMGVNIAEVTLHVGLGTFRPVSESDIRQHPMHSEWYEIRPEAAKLINDTRAAGGRIIAVGTTSTRTLEAAAGTYEKRLAGKESEPGGEAVLLPPEGISAETDIFIYPGYEFKVIDGLITNFHLPESTLLMLVSALAGRDNVMAAYETAVSERYRFFSFGDAMLVI